MRITPKIQPIYYKAIHKKNIEHGIPNNIGLLNHYSRFFRYPKTDEFLINYLNHLKKGEINIVSAGCSHGEEVYSYALGLLGKDVKINGFDISQEAINGAHSATYNLNEFEELYLNSGVSNKNKEEDKLITKNTLANRFHRNFTKNENGEYVLNDGSLDNCNFFVGNLTHTQKYFRKNSQDLVLCRYVFYHMNNKEIKEAISQFYEILKPEGLLCIDSDTYKVTDFLAKQHGFINPFESMPWIYQKPKQTNKKLNMASYRFLINQP